MSAELDGKKGIRPYVSALELLNDSLPTDTDKCLLNDARQLSAKIMLGLSDIVGKHSSTVKTLPTFIVEDLAKEDDAREYFMLKAFDIINSLSGESGLEEQGKMQFMIARFCYDKINDCDSVTSTGLVNKFVDSTLKAMSFGVDEARRYFPCLLKESYLSNGENQQIFISHSNAVESWQFLEWQTQVMSFLDKSIGNVMIPIVGRLVDDYPNAVIYNFKLTVDLKPNLLNIPEIRNIYKRICGERSNLLKFQKALKFVVKPNILLMQKIKKVIKKLESGIQDRDCLKQEFDLQDVEFLLSKNHSNAVKTYKNQILNALKSKPDVSIKQLNAIYKTIYNVEEKSKPKNDKLLSYYSPWLSNYLGCEIEIPGQYKGDKKPMLNYHAKVIKMDPNVTVMLSNCKPIRITMLGNDGKSYKFLAKSGEDLRLDQRIQQALSFMNNTLLTNPTCKQRNLNIFTYQVIPFDTNFGLIEWINDTKTLCDFIPLNQKIVNVATIYKNWICEEAGVRECNDIQKYRYSLKKTSSQVIKKMEKLINMIKWDCLRKTFFELSSSLECFVSMRHTFTITYATICLTHWILGIGDRHLKNTLVEIKSGRCIGIDFGLAFGAGVDLAIPELMPFRLTPQILGILKPFSEKDLFAVTMINVLKALKEDKSPLLACLDIFVNESLDWKEYIMNKSANGSEREDEVKWSPSTKIDIVKQKLNGGRPSAITLLELNAKYTNSSQKDEFDRYTDIIKGKDCDVIRNKDTNETLTPEEQVSHLLDQATDLNILGRTYHGWQPWL